MQRTDGKKILQRLAKETGGGFFEVSRNSLSIRFSAGSRRSCGGNTTSDIRPTEQGRDTGKSPGGPAEGARGSGPGWLLSAVRRKELPFRRYTVDVKLFLFALAAIAATSGCGRVLRPSFDSLTEEFVYGSLALTPVGATQAGYHEHKALKLDESLDDFSPRGIEAQRRFYADFKARLDILDTTRLSSPSSEPISKSCEIRSVSGSSSST